MIVSTPEQYEQWQRAAREEWDRETPWADEPWTSVPTFRGLVIHEYGHYLHFRLRRRNYFYDLDDMAQLNDYLDYKKWFNSFVDELFNSAATVDVSHYAGRNVNEGFAEAFTAYWLGDRERLSPRQERFFDAVVKNPSVDLRTVFPEQGGVVA